MPNQFLYDNEKERDEHIQAVNFLSETGGFAVEEVLSLYEQILEDLRHGAVIKSYLTVLVSRRVKRILKETKHPINA